MAPQDNRFTRRNKRIAFTCRPKFAEELRKLAFEKNCYQTEILEKALEIYQKSLLSNSEIKSNEVKPQKDFNINLLSNQIKARIEVPSKDYCRVMRLGKLIFWIKSFLKRLKGVN